MDIDPIYCAEQINIPADLADILKTFTKETIRRQPEDLVEFSAIYFSTLAEAARQALVQPPSKEQVQAVAGRMRLSTDPTVDELLSVAADTGISPGSLAKAQEAVPVVAENSLVYCNRVLLMLLTMTAGGLADTLHAVFDTFGDGGEMSADAFQLFFGYLAENDTELAGAVDQLQIDLAAETTVNFAKVSGTESLQALLAPPADA